MTSALAGNWKCQASRSSSNADSGWRRFCDLVVDALVIVALVEAAHPGERGIVGALVVRALVVGSQHQRAEADRVHRDAAPRTAVVRIRAPRPRIDKRGPGQDRQRNPDNRRQRRLATGLSDKDRGSHRERGGRDTSRRGDSGKPQGQRCRREPTSEGCSCYRCGWRACSGPLGNCSTRQGDAECTGRGSDSTGRAAERYAPGAATLSVALADPWPASAPVSPIAVPPLDPPVAAAAPVSAIRGVPAVCACAAAVPASPIESAPLTDACEAAAPLRRTVGAAAATAVPPVDPVRAIERPAVTSACPDVSPVSEVPPLSAAVNGGGWLIGTRTNVYKVSPQHQPADRPCIQACRRSPACSDSRSHATDLSRAAGARCTDSGNTGADRLSAAHPRASRPPA
jgi:hypothetical protein